MSCPEIAIHKKYRYGKQILHYVKRTQKDYSMSFKLQIVQEIEQRTTFNYRSYEEIWYSIYDQTIVDWLRKFGNFDWENQTPFDYAKITRTKNNGA